MFSLFDGDFNEDLNLLTHHSLISVRVTALWSQDHKLKTYTRIEFQIYCIELFLS